MLVINDDLQVKMFKGDTGSITVSISKNGTPYSFVDVDDTVYFSVKKTLDQLTYTLQKTVTTFTDGKAIITILPTDTSSLTPGVYFYDIEYVDVSGVVNTLVEEVEKFVLLGGVKND